MSKSVSPHPFYSAAVAWNLNLNSNPNSNPEPPCCRAKPVEGSLLGYMLAAMHRWILERPYYGIGPHLLQDGPRACETHTSCDPSAVRAAELRALRLLQRRAGAAEALMVRRIRG